MSVSYQVGSKSINISKILAEGGFGTVYLATLAGEGDSGPGASPQQYALKQLICQSREQFEEAETELQALQMFGGHVNIIRMIGMSLPLLLSVVTLLLCLVMMIMMMMNILT